MREIKLNKDNKIAVILEAIKYLEAGGTIIYPTETSYALGADFYSRAGMRKIYAIKAREKRKPLPVVVPSISAAATLVEFPDTALRLAMEYWPGPLTLVLPYRHCDWGICYDEYLALRVSSHSFVQALVGNYGKVLIATSANISGKENCYTPAEIKRQFRKAKIQPDLFINAGALAHRLPSTIIKCTLDNELTLLRQGELNVKSSL